VSPPATRPLVAVRNVRVPGCDEPVDLPIGPDGTWLAARPAGGEPCGPDELDGGGRLVLPGFVDSHVHLDKAYLLEDLEAAGCAVATLGDAIAATKRLRLSAADPLGTLVAHAERALGAMARHGTVAARAHLEVDPDLGLEPVAAQLELAGRWRDVVAVDTVAFPQNGLEAPGARRCLEQALELGCATIGSCPYVDEDPAGHLDHVCGLAAESGRRLDVHLDFSDDPAEAWVDALLDQVERRGLEGKVVVGHLTSLAVAGAEDRRRRIARLAATATTVVCLPLTDLYLNGRGDPPARGLTPLRQLLEGGVPVALGSNNHQNAFTPVGSGNLLLVATVAAVAGNLATAAEHGALVDAVTTAPAAAIGLPAWGTAPGAPASFALVDADSPVAALRDTAAVVASAAGGRLRVGRGAARR